VGDTDGFNFAFPDNIDDIKYVAKGNHWKTTEDGGKELTGLDAVLAEFNENYMEGRMGLDIDDVCSSTINFARKNYANAIDGKIKLVGNSVKSKKMSVYIEEFLGKAIRMLLDGDGHSFINYYYEYVDKIYNYQIPLVKIASKAKIKSTISDYKKKSLMKNKAGNPMPRQAHMELAIRDGLDVTLGDVLYYVNTGNSKSQGDLKTVDKNKMTKKQSLAFFKEHGEWPKPNKVVELNCRLIDPTIVERDFEAVKELEMLKKAIDALDGDDVENRTAMQIRIKQINDSLFTDDYNVARFLEAFNKKIKPLLVCFDTEIRDRILLDIVKTKDKTTKEVTERLKERVIFTKSECGLISGKPFKETDQDSYEELMTMEDKEIKFWDKVDKLPNYMEQEEWDAIRADYHVRMAIAKAEGIAHEKSYLDDIFKHLEVAQLNAVVKLGEMPVEVFIIADISTDGSGNLISRKWNEPLCHIEDIFKYEKDAIERDKYYQLMTDELGDDKYQQYLDYIAEQRILNGEQIVILDSGQNDITSQPSLYQKTEIVVELLKEKANEVIASKTEAKKKRVFLEGDEDDDELEMEEDEDGNLTRTEEILLLDDEVDDTYAEKPDDYEFEEIPPVVDEDEWLF
jgi:hypothetical protein